MAAPISNQLNLGDDLGRARAWILSDLGPVLAKAGYKVSASSTESVTFVRRYLPGWGVVLGIVTLPIGILILALVRSTQSLVIDLAIQDKKAVIATVSGVGPKKVAELFDRLNRKGVKLPADSEPPAQPRQ